eukprot:TRINITY_DN3096_c0_g1_i1.p1 TRINITY_DN3096_c0_g1~~TRINITY_DN3096_c0_g1_i1.p1  ORF type:complete len:220 (+),score=38.53 TRINITY_DN3096_c0_g1_i1:17-676(+)
MAAPKAVVLKVVLIGNSGCGKTSLMQQYVNKRFSLHYKATIGADFLSKEVFIDGRHVLLQIWDTAGQETFRSLGSAFYRGADGCVLVFDVTNRYTFECLTGWKENFLKTTNNREDSQGKFAAFVVMGNKADLTQVDGDQRVKREEVNAWCDKHAHQIGQVPYFETSASTGENVEQAFIALVKETLQRHDDISDQQPPTETINLNRHQPQKGQDEGGCSC